ncbi:non-ribosomal peptide synthetase [Hyphococcus lacteus]|uniref:Amino acid adenylation domain-containing protein n=1 Tax=Hyphococcus lacteus TaxID=3143536 RepID=A0ABV3Z306_9PROT
MTVTVDIEQLETCVDVLVTDRAQKRPDDVAVIVDDKPYTYRQLNLRVEAIAAALSEREVVAGNFVGVLLERSFDMVASVLAIMHCGAAYVPLDPEFPAQRLQHMIDDCGTRLVVSQSSIADIGLKGSFEFLFVEGVTDGSVTRAPIRPDDLAYVLYTSGSTGLPKGVAVEHRNVVNFLLSMAQEPGFTAADRLLAVTTLSFDIAGLELFLPLIMGGTVIIAERDDVVDGERLKDLISRHKVSVIQATPSTWRLLLEADWRGGIGFKAFCGGEALPVDLAQALSAQCDALWNMYGPTETTIWSSCYHLPKGGTPVLIGVPIANTPIYVLDKAGRKTPPGIPGEIYIGGAGVARGYLNREDLTAEKFLPDPFSGTEGARMYRTGDFGRYLTNGLLEYRERADAQVKIRGFRVELGDVESAITGFSDVKQSVCKVVEPKPGDTRLVAYIKASDIDVGALRAFLRDYLPNYMIPQHFVVVDNFPMTPNGKIDRRALPEPEYTEVVSENYKAPSTPTEECIAQTFSDVFGIEEISINANFFELGGHSILAMRVLSTLRKSLSSKISLRMIFEAIDIAALASEIDNLAPKKNDDDREELLF